jgi:hypothetical protein
MRIFKNKSFARFSWKNEIPDGDLCETIGDANRGLIAADLGGGVIKQRVARKGAGKSGGFRMLILFRAGKRAIFVHGFAKNEVNNIGRDDLTALKKLASSMLAYRDDELDMTLSAGTLTEVTCDGNNETIP